MHEQTPATRRALRDPDAEAPAERSAATHGEPAAAAEAIVTAESTAPVSVSAEASAAEASPAPAPVTESAAATPTTEPATAETEPSGTEPSEAEHAQAETAEAEHAQAAATAHGSGAAPGGAEAPTTATSSASSAADADPASADEPPVAIPGALGWVDPDAAAAPRPAPAFEVSGAPARPADLLARTRRRSILRPATVVPTVLLLLIVASYTAATLLWPLTSVAPTVRSVAVQPIAAPAAEPAWPAQGEAAIAIDGVPGTLSSAATAPESIASITKIVTALVVLDRLPLAPGEQGPSYAFTQADSADYWQYRARGESSLDVPVDGSLTELQMLQGMLIASANNYAQRLASGLFPSDAEFAAAANAYLAERGIGGITIVNPTGIEAGNTATPAALIALAERALANPVIAEIVRTPEMTLPGAGTFRNGNALLADPGVVGVKTGTLDAWNLLTAKDITVDGTTVRAYAAVLGQPGPDARNDATRALFTRIEQELQPRPSVTAGTVVGKVETLWSDDIDVVTASDASVVLWNGGQAQTSSHFDLGTTTAAGATVGTFTATGPVDSDTVDVHLAGEIEPPDPWWRLTHPLDLFGLNG
ncbi:D-alanyl-D-alanine carboxypeptidase family protein [Microbacterium trichothecenolyticum]|uniref:D-alanyl-D-alanine carboxypeptidase (Penicillin-binding protein 5/6) n=1 Tax=Microbacterium trichothecenolyticum TaxID=69370 RepID=A0ABU0TZ97_MICTR|nr:D-alanyl-D-alanine carboxypeptidase [Microbacterium trichothecenolyticum]MDQ1124277.1 D-alanyl-D-alanine carboxypeptidase (penicillin-binding protein 5/6) [Microbacterium trichothecenolyticum]